MTQSNPPTVSIVMPTYNRAHLIEPVIQSILEQDYKDFELLIVDDGSSDHTAEVVNAITRKDDRVAYIPLPQNGGIGYARDEGLAHVNPAAQYVALADSDDFWVAGRLGKQVDILERYLEIELLFGDFDNVDHINGTRASGMKQSAVGMAFLKLKELEPKLYFVEGGIEPGMMRSNFIGAPTVIIRHEVLTRIGGFQDRLRSPDLEFGWRAAALGVRFAFIDDYLIERHRLGDSYTADKVGPSLDRLEALAVCRKTAETLPNREQLERSIGQAEYRTYRNIIHHYGEQGDRRQVFKMFRQSTRYGIDLRTAFLAFLGLIGPFAVKGLYIFLQTRQKAGNLRLSSSNRQWNPESD
jgi:glycosyltransferase involved in cell wall biosynthesis